MEVGEAVDVAIQVASALAAAHETGIVHRDIKPENIMLRPDGYVKVLDFGIAKLAEQEVPVTLAEEEAVLLVETHLGSIMGTVRYMSPEQARGAQVDKRTDVWSLGVVLYEMVTGHPPFTDETPREVMTSILEKEPPPLTSYNKQTPAELQQIVSKTLRKDRTERYQSAHELLEALQSLRRSMEFKAALERSTKAPLWLRWARSPIASVLLLLVAALALALPFYWHRNLTPSSPPEKSIAVLPFLDLSETKAQEYFCDGMSEEILEALAKVEGLRVVARTSSFSFKGKSTEVSEVGKKLNVENVLEGSLRREGNRVRITAQLINTRNGFHLWSETYDRTLDDLLAIRTEVAAHVAKALKGQLLGEDQQQLTKRGTDNAEAHRLYLQGRQLWNRRNGESLKQAIEYLNQAVGKDPSYPVKSTRNAKRQ
jgi:TolB-like protein